MIITECKEAPRVQLTAREIKEMFSDIDAYYSMLIKMATELPNCKAFHIYVTEPGLAERHLNFLFNVFR